MENHIILKLNKIFECSCVDGFTGDFCEFKTEQDHLLFIDEEWDPNSDESIYIPLVFNVDGRLIEENAVIDQQAGAYGSCSTILNGMIGRKLLKSLQAHWGTGR